MTESSMQISDKQPPVKTDEIDGFVHVRGAQENNLRTIDVDIPRNALVVFTGVSGSGKSSLAFDTIYAESQRRYFESIAPYARRLMSQLPAPRVTEIRGLPPAVALEQRRAEATTRSTVGTLTTLSNLLRMLLSRAGTYPEGAERLDSDAFSPNTQAGACDACHGIGLLHEVTEDSLVPDPSLTIREGAIAAWPGAWQGKNLRDILHNLGYDVDKPWRELSRKDRDWILFTDEKPVVTVHAEREAHRIQRPYQGTYMSAAHYVLHTFANTKSTTLRKRASLFMESRGCTSCGGKRLKASSLAVRFNGFDIADLGRMPLGELARLLAMPEAHNSENADSTTEVARLIIGDLIDRVALLTNLGLDYLSMDRSTPTLSSGELQRLRLTTQLRSGLFGVIYVLDEPSAGLHPADTESLFEMLKQLQQSGNSLFIVEHELDIIRQADWLVDIGPGAGERGGTLLYSGPVAGLAGAEQSVTRQFVFPDTCRSDEEQKRPLKKAPAKSSDSTSDNKSKDPDGWLRLRNIYRHNLRDLDVEFPLAVLTAVTGISGSGKSTLISQVLADIMSTKLGSKKSETEDAEDEEGEETDDPILDGEHPPSLEGGESIRRLVCVDQKPIGKTPRSNLATYTGLFDHIRKLYATTDEAKKRKYNAGRFSFNVAGGRCTTCEGEGFVSVELLFLPSVYAPCSSCHGTRYNPETLEIIYQGRNIAEILELTVEAACDFFASIPSIARSLKTLSDVGLGYLSLGQPATELSGGEAQRIKLATELQRVQRGDGLYLLDEPTSGLHPADTKKLLTLLKELVKAGNTVIVVEHDMDVIAAADWVIDMGPGAGSQGGKIVTAGPPHEVAQCLASRTAPYLKARLAESSYR